MCAITPDLLPNRMLNDSFYHIKDYGSHAEAKSACRDLFSFVIDHFKKSQTPTSQVRTISFSSFDNKKIDRTAVIEAALNNELSIYIKRDTSKFYYLGQIEDDCGLLNGNSDFDVINLILRLP